MLCPVPTRATLLCIRRCLRAQQFRRSTRTTRCWPCTEHRPRAKDAHPCRPPKEDSRPERALSSPGSAGRSAFGPRSSSPVDQRLPSLLEGTSRHRVVALCGEMLFCVSACVLADPGHGVGARGSGVGWGHYSKMPYVR